MCPTGKSVTSELFWEVSISKETVSMVTGRLSGLTDNGLTIGGHHWACVSVLAWVPGCLAGSSSGLFYFILMSEK